jgi:hypothetical protein
MFIYQVSQDIVVVFMNLAQNLIYLSFSVSIRYYLLQFCIV